MNAEQIAAKSQELHQFVDQLVSIVQSGVEEQTPIHEIERKVLDTLLQAGQTTLQLFVDCAGDGDCGPVYQTSEGVTLKRSEQPHMRPYVCIFGPLYLQRYVYARRPGQKIEFVETDARLALPESKFSYQLQDWDQSFAMEQPFAKSADTIKKILNLEQHVDSLERMNRDMSMQADRFNASQSPPPTSEEGEVFVQSADGKGVPIRRPADTAPIDDHEHRTGPKPDRKKMATIGAVYSVDRNVRTPEEVVKSLFRDPQPQDSRQRTKRPRPAHKRMRAILNHTNSDGDAIHGRTAIFGWIADEIKVRHRSSDKPIVNIMDGDEDLWSMRDTFQPNVPMVDILDLLHVTPRLWDAASLLHGRGSKAAKKFVRQRALRILRGEIDGVTRGLHRLASTRLSGKARQKMLAICRYFQNNRERMRYDEYLKAGYPIASGVIEGACRHVVKDRLERTGMSWTPEGAQAMLDLRCFHLTKQWDTYVTYRVKRETQRLYPYRDTLPDIEWPIAA